MKKLVYIFGYLLLVSFLLLTVYLFFETTYYLAVNRIKLYMWFGVGAGAYLLSRRLPFLSKNTTWFETWTHELTHTVVGLMFFNKIHSFRAEIGSGEIYHSGRNNIFITLAPYCLPIYTYIFCLFRLLSAPGSLYIFDILIGLTFAFHLFCFFDQARPYQTDIQRFGVITSYLFIIAFLLFNTLVVLLTIRMEIGNAFVYMFDQYSKIVLKCWELL